MSVECPLAQWKIHNNTPGSDSTFLNLGHFLFEVCEAEGIYTEAAFVCDYLGIRWGIIPPYIFLL